MCLVLAWKTRLAARNVTPKLSHHRTGRELHLIPNSESKELIQRSSRELHLIPNSESKELIQRSSVVAMAKLLYSASVDDLETVACFLEDQEIKFGPRKIPKPVVDFLSSGHPVQSVSVKSLRLNDVEPARYRKILFTAN
jgi:hypothetical protein